MQPYVVSLNDYDHANNPQDGAGPPALPPRLPPPSLQHRSKAVRAPLRGGVPLSGPQLMQIAALWQKGATPARLGTGTMAPPKWPPAPVSGLSNVNPAQQYAQDKADKAAAILGKSVYVKVSLWLLKANKKGNMEFSQVSHLGIHRVSTSDLMTRRKVTSADICSIFDAKVPLHEALWDQLGHCQSGRKDE